ncbi:hypothetical protein ACFQ0B_52230 [Nonomuraea thailandensis]
MRAPSKLRLAVAGLAAGGVLAGSGLIAAPAQAQVDDPFGFGGSSGGSSFDFGLTQPQPGSGSSGSSSGGFGDFFKDLGKDLGKQLTQEALKKLLDRNKNNGNTSTQPNTTLPQLPTGEGVVPSEDLTQQLPSTTSAGKRVPETVEKVLREAGINFVDWIVKRQPGSQRRGFGSFRSRSGTSGRSCSGSSAASPVTSACSARRFVRAASRRRTSSAATTWAARSSSAGTRSWPRRATS